MNEFDMVLWSPWDAMLSSPNLAGDVETPITPPMHFTSLYWSYLQVDGSFLS